MHKNFFDGVLGLLFLLTPLAANASFIEATIGAAVVNDATATYFNPAALTLLKNKQVVTLGTLASFHTQFTGQATQTSGFTLSGTTHTQTNYFLPSVYFGMPATDRIYLGVAVLSNVFNRDIEQNSILRYVQSDNNIQDIDVVPAVGLKINDSLACGVGLNFSHANFLFRPTSGIPALNIPDSQSRNDSSANAVGGDVGLLLKPTSSTLIGLNYRSAITYHFHGTSVFEGPPPLASNNFSFNFWTPARTTLSVNQDVNSKLGIIGTAQWIQWSIFDKINLHNVATQIGSQAVIIPEASVPYHLQDSWVFTLGSYYHMTSKWTIRAAGSFVQSPGNAHFQICNGDSIILGASTGYKIGKHFVIDGSYAHAFIKNQPINIVNQNNTINGTNKGYRDSVSLKLTFNL